MTIPKPHPCPYCGSETYPRVSRTNIDPHWVFVRCQSCFAEGPCFVLDESKAIAAWNRVAEIVAAWPKVVEACGACVGAFDRSDRETRTYAANWADLRAAAETARAALALVRSVEKS